ncbi:transcription antitermination factor NusB [Anaerosacchariphilus sp. NSJ-68]|uniref:Transcription antitermination protein NusB n=2 Tax=Lachnospiraceae TaxID=186803 RepID=A0A923RMA3_9FIRM|nr:MULTISPECIES: transcription antitermination factor NusB [Lachnospiraceae]MBC5660083.1 transcription antitermination factor NusB [Anaerosacchariphilus hominis]MBC5699198.1 transcription antitermination factor NusB [Roseburia difficilis]
MKRRELREHIFELLFRVEFNSPEEMQEQVRLFFENLGEIEDKDRDYIKQKYAHIIEKLPEIDALLGEAAEGWKVSRMGKADLTILRLAVYEMKYDEDVPVGVAVNEAVELSKKFGGDESPVFINGILGKIGKAE